MKQVKTLSIILIAILFVAIIARRVEFTRSTAKAEITDLPKQQQTTVSPIQKVIPKERVTATNASGASEGSFSQAQNLRQPEKLKGRLCLLKKYGATVPMGRGTQAFFSNRISALGEHLGYQALIKSPQCPSGKHSIVYFNDQHEVEKQLDCRTASSTELSRQSGHQGEIIDVPGGEGILNLAISGPGHFVLQCPESGILLTRFGRFTKTEGHSFQNQDGCTLLNEEGHPFLASEDINSMGCSKSNPSECVALLNPSSEGVVVVKYLNPLSFKAEGAAFFERSPQTRILSNALETFVPSKNSFNGIQWETQPPLNIDEFSCTLNSDNDNPFELGTET